MPDPNTPVNAQPGAGQPVPQIVNAKLTATQASAPSIGALIGGATAPILISALHVTDANTAMLLTSAIVTAFVALFHFIGHKLGAPDLG